MDLHDTLAPLDSPRKNGGLLKSTSLAVLAQRRTHKTQTQKNFEQFNKQRLTMNQSAFHPPRYNSSISSNSLKSQSSSTLMQLQQQYQRQQQQQLYQQEYYPHSTESFVPVQPVLPQGTRAVSYEHADSIGTYSPSSSEFTFELEDTKYTSPDTSNNSDWNNNNEWRDFSQPTIAQLEEDLAKMKQELERLQSVEVENIKLKAENESLTAQLEFVKSDNDKLFESSSAASSPASARSPASLHAPTMPAFNEYEETVYKELEDKDEELTKTLRLCEELEVKFTDTTQHYNKLKLIHKTNMDMKNREIARLKEDLKEMDSYLSGKSNSTPETSPMSPPSPNHMISATSTPSKPKSAPTPLSTKKELPIQMTQSMSEELLQDLLYTIRTLKSLNETLTKEKQQLMVISEKDRRVLRSFAHSSRNKVKIRKGLTLVSEVDTLI